MPDRNIFKQLLPFCKISLFCAVLLKPDFCFSRAEINQFVQNLPDNSKIISPDTALKSYLEGKATASFIVLSYNGSGLSIAICDTGIDTSHPMLGGGFPNSKVIGGYDTGDDDNDPRPNPTLGQAHGTSCAGIAAGSLDSVGDYIGGVAPGARLYAVKISTGNTGSTTVANMIEGWEWCITHQFDNANYLWSRLTPIRLIS